ncbi:hypothetical protein HYH03_004908 [Edaphochlamys debaryana]|uniref:Uncharacterized protein n=1 Tax=Edaphochlamys debaryana TaxID=47281 RepID=A0A836C1H0_9CHLO|nr:hypothetical protein HYH03_004908 [Edaphochlamys debaryana]|eukprot:KAG2496901.1 hypothetical protein HYH03_004908 [Edaphochlamys debaryana]
MSVQMHPGATSLLNQCDNAATGGLTGVKPSAWTAYDFYCNAGMDATQVGSPRARAPARTTIRYTYPLDAHVPGVHLYHPHHHGSISSQMPTTAGPIIVPEACEWR